MKHLSSFVLLLLLGLSFATLPALVAPPATADARSIVGVWKGGMPGEPPGSMELTITPEKIIGRNPRTGENLGEGTYQLDPVSKTIDVLRVEKYGRSRAYYGLYALEGDTLRWVSNSRGKQRPKDMVHRADRDQWLMVLKPQK